ncbi:MAG: glycosyltransferase family 2 protein [Nitrosopumilus sp.]|nr:glycosyltransferase family 2 protein [Nitrosopumilus sp.]NNL58027.1 glycosyltransferase family 2 protein [Nitrosopumilus sp.]
MKVAILEQINKNAQISIIIPTYNESQNILSVLKSVTEYIPKKISTQTIVVDDNSPDGTGKLVEDYLKNLKKVAGNTIKIINRTAKTGLSSAILSGIKQATGDIIVVMDSDFSHPPQIIPKMIEAIKKYQCDVVVASRYIHGGNIQGWPTKRKFISKIATLIAKKGLDVKVNDPMSGFFAFKKNAIKGISFDAIGYKFLLEILVKNRKINVKEIPYTFQERKFGASKLDYKTVTDYLRSVWKLYRFGQTKETNEKRSSVKFISKAARFYTVGASGFAINYLVSLFLSDGFLELWYLHANAFGIIFSITTNFLLNKTWTFNDRDFNKTKTLKQFGKFVLFSSIGALIQLGVVFTLVDNYSLSYPLSLSLAVLTAAFGNFILNKKLTFKEKLLE